MTTIIFSSHGEFIIDPETGLVFVSDIDDCDTCPHPLKFDVEEYKSYHHIKELPEGIDILDIGYDEEEFYEPPCQSWREYQQSL